ncbi:MAG TPA: DUF1570 domain-containing protein [Lacunisphaera sp.]|nr:DUF1570 domain-containing protein [Lacunisphaera sp.]
MPRSCRAVFVAPLFLLPILSDGHAPAQETAAVSPELQARLETVAKTMPSGFTAIAEPPFVVVGDEEEKVLHRRAASIVRMAVSRLKQDFFPRDPAEQITIWLFKDRTSYESGTLRIFGERHISPFGYYSPKHQALIMNIATGGGTLVHEIVHPFIRANFPDCPPWFNEGLASLFEASAVRDGHLVGLTNWRLPGLQAAIRDHRTLSFAALFALNHDEFYADPVDGYNRHYGQARYLCYYLQEHGLLQKFYREFSAHVTEDPTGLRSLQRVLDTDDVVAFQARWEKYVLELKTR